MARAKTKKKRDDTAPAGEPMVWFTSMGLAAGLCLVIFLLWVIVANGLPVFWPKRVVEVKLRPESAFDVGGTKTFAGEVSEQRLKSDGSEKPETKFYVGNRDAYGYTFVFVDDEAIVERTKPEAIAVFDRMEDSRAVGYPEKLVLADGTEVAVDSAGFDNKLVATLEEVEKRRGEINQIEKGKIGRINHKLQQLRFKEIEGKGDPDAIAKERAELQAEFEKLNTEAKDLRAKQEEVVLHYRLAGGEQREMAIGELLHYYYPNQLGFWARLGKTLANFWHFLSENPRQANMEGGVFPAIFGTFVMTVLMSALVTPLGVVAAIYLREYAKQGFLVRSVRIAVNNLAGVPSIVFGAFGFGFFIYVVGAGIDDFFFSTRLADGSPTFGTGGILWASATLALMTIPVVIVATEEALAAVPRGMREASLACGASKWQTIQRIVLPASIPGIITGLVLAMARGAGEVAPLMLVGAVKEAESLPIDAVPPFIHLDQKFMHLGFHIYDLGFQSPDSEAAKPMVFATTLLLISLVVVLNLAAIVIRERLRRKYATSAF